jgi:uncharacterized membrane protein (UPF0127 family)
MPNWVQVRNKTKGTLICKLCLFAETWLQRLIGLMGRKSLGREEGLLLTKAAGGVHTCFMRFAIDVAYLNERGQVIAVKENMKPWRIWIVRDRSAVMALELPSGRLKETATEVGDLLEFLPL